MGFIMILESLVQLLIFTIRVLMPNYSESIECFIPLRRIALAVITWYVLVLMSMDGGFIFARNEGLGVVWEWREVFK
jgi:Na+-translocating ferredoxin:NAD+ oxidoreductase RnfA subunit